MADHIKIRPASGTWSVRVAGAVLGETANALELSEGDYAPVVYFPRTDLAMAMFDQSDKTSVCPWKGTATYFSIDTGDGVLQDAAWSYEKPIEAVGEIAGHIAFYSNDDVTVEEL